jgi:hypothetical protein
MMKSISTMSKRLGIALVAVFLSLCVVLGVSVSANAAESKGGIAGCNYDVRSSGNIAVVTVQSATAGGCRWVYAYVQASNITGSVVKEANEPMTIPSTMTTQVTTQSPAPPSGYTTFSWHGVFSTDHAGTIDIYAQA